MSIQEIIKSMSLEEKASLCSGRDFWNLKEVERLNIPSIMMTDGPHGLRKQIGSADHVGLNDSIPATCFPPAVTTASSWDRALMRKIGTALGEECLQEEVAVILGPGANIKRTPLCGRNFEYLSEDPFVTGEMASAFINGVQSMGVGTSLKHYAANNAEKLRMTMDSVVDERALREIYLSGFEKAVKDSKPWTVMCAYNKLNGTYCSENNELLNHILREEWGFEGVVVTDWGACNDRVLGLKAGQDLEMPSSQGINDDKIVEAVRTGQLHEAVLDKTVERLLKMIFKSKENRKSYFKYNAEKHHALAKKAAAESMVLLKNKDNILPLNKSTKVAVIGEFATKPRYQGAGSSLIKPTKLDSVCEELANQGVSFVYSKGYDISEDKANSVLIEEACKVSKDAEVVLLFTGLTEKYESEGYDREHMRMPEGHNELIKAISEENENVVVVLLGGSPVDMPWIPKIKGLLNAYLGGQAGAGAVVDILFGKVNPSGKLAETYPMQLSHNLSYEYLSKSKLTTEYRESIYVGYRYYDTSNAEVLFPFGYGLSYTHFEYSDIKVSKEILKDTETITVSVKVKNAGKIAGAEIVQLYIRDLESTIFRPVKELKGFEKLSLEPAEEKTAAFVLDKRSFAYYNTNIKDWHVEEGKFEILVGASSRDIRQKTVVFVNSSQADVIVPDYRNTAPCYYSLGKGNFQASEEEFKAIYGSELPPSVRTHGEEFTMNSTMGELSTTFIGKLLLKIMLWQAKKTVGSKNDESSNRLIEVAIVESPIRALVMMSNGAVPFDLMKGIVMLANGRFLKGIDMLMDSVRKGKKKSYKRKYKQQNIEINR